MPSGETTLSTELARVPSIGPERTAQLANLELHNVLDLLLHRPRRYEDRRSIAAIRDLKLGEATLVTGRITAMGVKRFRKGRACVFELILEDETGRLHCRWWNQAYRENYFKVGQQLLVYGKPKELKPRTMDQPETEFIEDAGDESAIHMHRIVPVYPLTEGLHQRWLRALIHRTLPRALPEFDKLALPIPAQAGVGSARVSRALVGVSPTSKTSRGQLDLPSPADLTLSLREAVELLHKPRELSDLERCRKRLALEELVRFQMDLQRRRKNLLAKANSLPCPGTNELMRPFLSKLPFKLTASQSQVLREIREDLSKTIPMRRLLQGDVGSGKTVVAACAGLMAIESGASVALMAPTEILAEQHYQKFKLWFNALGIPVALRTGSSKLAPDSEALLAWKTEITASAQREAIHIGTHALIQNAVEIERLGLVIIDEQHKFGVSQREKLVRKGAYPHLLVMTATPIPRTLGLTVYGDLDSSALEGFPAGRGKIRTFVRPPEKLPQVWEFVKEKLKLGQQAYIVHPRVDESSAGVKAVLLEHKNIAAALAPHKVAVLHGRMSGEEKERVMEQFRSNKIQALLATPLIEVGVDVPNATLMIIENAEQFGLAQLHQLRGRIGRGALDSYCVLVASARTDEASERLAILEKTNDGFEIAEADLRLRGPGELLGHEQAGSTKFKFADLATDLALVEQARALAKSMLDK